MTATQLESALTTEALSSWHRTRSTDELLSLITRREQVLDQIDDLDIFEALEA